MTAVVMLLEVVWLLLSVQSGAAATDGVGHDDGYTSNRDQPGVSVPLALFGAEDLTGVSPQAHRSTGDLRFFGMYSAAITIGGQRFNVQLDTGSSNLMVPAVDCDGCIAGLRRYRQEDSPSSELVDCKSPSCSGYCNPTECRPDKGATCDVRDAPPPWALGLLPVDNPRDSTSNSCSDDIQWRGPDGRGCDKYRENAEWCGEGESVARCAASCRSCGRCCTASGGCFFQQTYADQTGGTGALYSDNISLVGLDRSGDRAVTTARVTFGAASLVTHSASAPFAPLGVDGVLGIGYSWLNCHPTCVSAPLDALLESLMAKSKSSTRIDAGDHNVFALCLTTPSVAARCINRIHVNKACADGTTEATATFPRTYEGAGGSWDIGWQDSAKYVGQLQYLPILHESYYIVRAPIAAKVAPSSATDSSSRPNEKGFGVSDMVKGLSPKMWGLTVFDSGTAHSLMPPAVFKILKPWLLSKLKLQKNQSSTAARLSRIFDDMCVRAPAGGFSEKTIAESFPVLQLVFRGLANDAEGVHSSGHGRPFPLNWGPEYYLYLSPNNPFASLSENAEDNVSTFELESGHEQWLCSGIIASGDRTVLGASFLRGFYTVFDRANKRIGVAPSTSKCIPKDACVETCIAAVGQFQPLSLKTFGAGVLAVAVFLGCRRRCSRVVLSMFARCCG